MLKFDKRKVFPPMHRSKKVGGDSMRGVGWAIHRITKPLTTGAFAAAIAFGLIYAFARILS